MDKRNESLNKNMIYKNEKLSKYNWFNLGGAAKVFFKPNSQLDLSNFLKKHSEKEKNIYILGAGSNTLFRDSGFDGIIIKLGKDFSYTKLLKDNKKAWELIKSSKCTGLTVGGASISPKHSNFFLNNGQATASDIENLIEKVKKEVFLKTGTNMELEIKIIGDK